MPIVANGKEYRVTGFGIPKIGDIFINGYGHVVYNEETRNREFHILEEITPSNPCNTYAYVVMPSASNKRNIPCLIFHTEEEMVGYLNKNECLQDEIDHIRAASLVNGVTSITKVNTSKYLVSKWEAPKG